MVKKGIKIVLVLCLGLFIGTILLIGSYLFPAEIIEKNVSKSIDIFKIEDTYNIDIYGYYNTNLDNFTDAIMLQSASYTGDNSIIDKSMNVYRYSNDAGDDIPSESIIDQMDNKKDIIKPYDRYWHGYLVFLKPLLMIFSYNDLRFINSMIEPLLIIAIVYLLIKNNKAIYVLPYIISIIMINPMAIAKSLTYSTIFYLFNISIIVMLLYNKKLKNRYTFYFLIIGMATSYFDLLSYPLVTLGMPLIMYLILNQDSISSRIKFIISKSIIWGIGYVGMWIGKIAIGSILLNRNLFTGAINIFLERSSFESGSQTITISDIFASNIYFIKPFIILILAFILYKVIKARFQIKKSKLKESIPFIIISIMPFAWYIVASNHSCEHCFFTYRILMITVFSLLTCLTFILENPKKRSKGE